MEIDISKIVKIPSETEVPVHNNSIQTKRPLCTNFPENTKILNNLEKLQVIFPEDISTCDSDLFKNIEINTIDNIDELKKFLSKLLIKFDTSPKNYTKDDYGYLLAVLYKSLLRLYQQPSPNLIIDEWSEEPSSEKVPSERLVKIEIDNKQNTLIAGEGIDITDNVISNTRTSAEWGNVTGNLSDQTDLQNVLDQKANTSDIPTNISQLDNDSGYLTQETDPTVPNWAKLPNKPSYTASEVGALPSSTVIPSKTSQLNNDSGFITSKDIPIVDKTSDISSSFAIDPNKMYMFGNRTSLTITLNAGTSGIVNEYMFQFTSGSTATTLNVPSSVKWLQNPNIQSNKKYAVSIENNLGIIGEWNI